MKPTKHLQYGISHAAYKALTARQKLSVYPYLAPTAPHVKEILTQLKLGAKAQSEMSNFFIRDFN